METQTFETNINCGGCIAKVTPALNQAAGENNWKADSGNPQTILTVESNEPTTEEIETVVRSAGFTVESCELS